MKMGFAENYFFRHTFLLPQITEPPSGLLCYIVVIPAYLEEDLISTLNLLKMADKPNDDIEALIVINFSETDSVENKNRSMVLFKELTEWCKIQSGNKIRFRAVLADNLPKKHAGAGLARKIGMDLALYRFNQIDRPGGMILSLDADTQIEKNYFTAVEKILKSEGNDIGGCIIRFAHSIEGNIYSDAIYNAIVSYELHLRYYKNILQYIGFPFAMYTIGSCFGVRADVYARHGGMNRKKAGEDFYFLNKLFSHERFIEVNETCVYPSPRPSLRVAFGTGPVIHEIISSGRKEFLTYNPQAFYDLGKLFLSIDDLFNIHTKKLESILSGFCVALREFLIQNSFSEKLKEVQQNTASPESFRKRFYLWFDGFRVVKYLNFSHKKCFNKIPVQQAVLNLLASAGIKIENGDERYLLAFLRKMDMEG